MRSILSIIFLAMLTFTAFNVHAQKIPDVSKVDTGKMYLIIKNDGTQFAGKVLSMDSREIVLETKNIGQVSIPKHEIKLLRPISASEISATGQYVANETFATRYVLTTNGLPIEKGESYILWNWYGPDMQFGVGENFSLGVMTSWFAMPVIGSAKYSFELGKNTHMAVGTLLGTGSWALPKFGMALPFASLTYGNRRNNITFSGGYGAVWGYGVDGGRALLSVAGMVKVSKKASLVFDSFIMPGNTDNKDYTALYMPAIRLQTGYNKAFQFGFAGISSNGHTTSMPMLQWFRML